MIDLRACSIGAIVLDIEGTTTPIAFVYSVLFPYARRHIREFLREHWSSQDVHEAVNLLRDEHERDVEGGETLPAWSDAEGARVSSVAAYVEWLMDRDRKSRGLKVLQGLVWERGYRSGALKSDVFSDVAPALRAWNAAGLRVAIYSSGSVLAQRLLFGHTNHGDLTTTLSGFFDTAIGVKTEAESYRRIAEALGQPPQDLLFISDSTKELDAAHEAGCHVLLCARPGNPPPPEATSVGIVRHFDELAVR